MPIAKPENRVESQHHDTERIEKKLKPTFFRFADHYSGACLCKWS